MRKILIGMFAGVLFLLGSTPVNAQGSTRITMSPGIKTKIVAGTLNGYRAHRTFVIRLRRGQRLMTENVGKNRVTVSITPPFGSTYEPDLAADCHDRNDVTRTAAGDYKIIVTECMKADKWRGTFRLRVSVR